MRLPPRRLHPHAALFDPMLAISSHLRLPHQITAVRELLPRTPLRFLWQMTLERKTTASPYIKELILRGDSRDA
jgi:hypothetical protein